MKQKIGWIQELWNLIVTHKYYLFFLLIGEIIILVDKKKNDVLTAKVTGISLMYGLLFGGIATSVCINYEWFKIAPFVIPLVTVGGERVFPVLIDTIVAGVPLLFNAIKDRLIDKFFGGKKE